MKIEGKNPVKELISANGNIEKIMIVDGTSDSELRQIQKLARDKGIKVEFVDRRALDKKSETGHHQGVIAIQSEFEYAELSEVIKNAKNANTDMLFIILDEICDPHNLGSIIRVSECAGATAVIIPNRRSATVNETVIRTSAGATAHIPVVKVSNINNAIEELNENGFWVYALDMDGELMYEANLTGNIGLVIGGEGSGVKPLTRKLCDDIVSIPMFGKINSLNASVSAGIGIYEVIRQRTK